MDVIRAFKTVDHSTLALLDQFVNEALAEGWSPQGGSFVAAVDGEQRWCISLMRKEKPAGIRLREPLQTSADRTPIEDRFPDWTRHP